MKIELKVKQTELHQLKKELLEKFNKGLGN